MRALRVRLFRASAAFPAAVSRAVVALRGWALALCKAAEYPAFGSIALLPLRFLLRGGSKAL
jgi:hypothetical protein